jgi:hypothetical protein
VGHVKAALKEQAWVFSRNAKRKAELREVWGWIPAGVSRALMATSYGAKDSVKCGSGKNTSKTSYLPNTHTQLPQINKQKPGGLPIWAFDFCDLYFSAEW